MRKPMKFTHPLKILTFQERWEEFKVEVYPDGMTDDQKTQLYNTFMAGALVSMCACISLAELPDAEAEIELCKLRHELAVIGDDISKSRQHP